MRILPILAGVLIAGAAYAQPTPPPPDMLPPYPAQPGAAPPQGQYAPPQGQYAPPPDQTQGPPPPGDMQGPPPGGHNRPPHLVGRARFDAANTSHDGRLTVQQAQAAEWRPVVRHFQEIDRDHKGYVTLQDIHEWHLAHKTTRQQTGAPPG